jgi:hypothetical protein
MIESFLFAFSTFLAQTLPQKDWGILLHGVTIRRLQISKEKAKYLMFLMSSPHTATSVATRIGVCLPCPKLKKDKVPFSLRLVPMNCCCIKFPAQITSQYVTHAFG